MMPATDFERPFLTAEWRNLVMLSYAVDPILLRPYLPRGTDLDTFGGRTFVSLVAFQFMKTRIWGRLAIPFHSNFEEVNFRFYVRREIAGEVRRGVVFIAELVPRYAIAAVARLAYNENYSSHRLTHSISSSEGGYALRYNWASRQSGKFAIEARIAGEADYPAEGSEQQFIAEHYWGYAKQRDGGTEEYRVEHAPWRVWNAQSSGFSGDGGAFYGAQFADVLATPPASAFVADGSPVKVFKGRRIAP
jgi:uncharacterized protein YqjF (DUF2071 family)